MDALNEVVMACGKHWTSALHVGSHQWARWFLAQGARVAFVSSPLSPAQILAHHDTETRERLRILKAGGIHDADGRLFAYVPFLPIPCQLPAAIGWDILYRTWPALSLPARSPCLSRMAFVIVIYFTSISGTSAWIKTLRPNTVVFRVTDLYEGFANKNRCMDREFRKTLEEATHVVYTAEAIGEQLARLGRPDGIFVGNGVDYSHFAAAQPLPDEYRTLPRPIVVFVGGLDSRLNTNWIYKAANAIPTASFVLVGPNHGAHGHESAIPANVHLLGPRPYASIPSYMQHADIGIIPFDLSRSATLVKGTNPLKVYQYCAAGLPVVASKWPELERVGSPACLCDTADEFIDGLRGTIRCHSTSEAGRRFARQHEWENKIGSFMREAQLA